MQSFRPLFLDIAAWPSRLALIGDAEILNAKKLALFCSRQCPGNLILKAYDLARELREAGTTVISGFHTPVEKECLRILLRGSQPVIICPARSIEGMRIPSAWKQPIAQGRLLLLSMFEEKHRRITSVLAEERNRFVAEVADQILFIHAAKGSATERFAHEQTRLGKCCFVLNSSENQNLLDIGVRPFAS